MLERRFLVFGGPDYYPGGGWGDFVGAFASLEASEGIAASYVLNNGWGTWSHVADLETGEVVKAFSADDFALPSENINPDRLQGREESMTIRVDEAGLRIIERII